MKFRRGRGSSAYKSPTPIGERTIREHQRHGPGPTGKRGQRFLVEVHAVHLEHAFDRNFVDLAGTFARDNQPCSDLSQFDAVGDVEHAVKNAQAGIAEVINGRFWTDTEPRRDTTGRCWFKLLPADAAVDNDLNVLGRDLSGLQRFPGPRHRPLGKALVFFPPAPPSPP